MVSAHPKNGQVELGFIKNTRDMVSLSLSGILLLSAWSLIYRRKLPKYRHVFVCVDGLCLDLTTDGLDYWLKQDILPEIFENTDWVTIDTDHDVLYDAAIAEQLGTHISRADIIRAFFNLPVKGEFCSSFAAKLIGLDVPKTITPDELYSLLNLVKWQH